MDNFGSATYKGTLYQLTSQAELTNRVFAGWRGDAGEGDEYTAEWSAYGISPDGDRVVIVWQWTEIKGDELDDASCYGFDDCWIVKVVFA